MPPKFGTSGLRGLVTELTQPLVADYTRAFLAACPTGGTIFLGQDLRASSPQIAAWISETVLAEGQDVVTCGALPTPALALAAQAAGRAAIMVTGSHIPADRNGLKFYTPAGEISKDDETRILAHLGRPPAQGYRGKEHDGAAAARAYAARYMTGFGPAALRGLRVGVYQHSSVARDILVDVFQALGAETVPLGRSDVFVPVDTEAMDADTREMLAGWCATHDLAAVVSTDGDADRPMLTDAMGRIVPGDVLGALTARALEARVICTPISSNSMVTQMPGFDAVQTTRIGSPYVIAAMEQALRQQPEARVVGYEANGGFLLGFAAEGPAGPLAPLMTRDCLLPVLAPLAAARTAGLSLGDLVADLPPRFTAADRLTGIAPERAADFLADLRDNPTARAAFLDGFGAEQSLDLTDGLRLTLEGGAVVHLRPSGNAPEFRCYTEAASPEAAADLLQQALIRLKQSL